MPEMPLDLARNGIVHRRDDGATTVLHLDRNGGSGVETEVPPEIADAFHLSTGDVVEGDALPLVGPNRPGEAVVPSERLVSVRRINSLMLEEAEERPYARSRRSHAERIPPDRWLRTAVGPEDVTGRMLEFAAPLGTGGMGVVMGSHGSGLTRTLRAVLHGIVAHAPDCVPLVLLLRARGEEITDWRRRFPTAEVVVCPSGQTGAAPEQTLRVADLVLEAAQRQAELGRDVVLLIDSLTGLWGTMLEMEDADAQAEADRSHARQAVREWVQRAGCFRGDMPLGGSMGGSLTIIGSVWHQPLNEEEEEDHELHPHLRLMEHITPDVSWKVSLSTELARRRLYPAIDVRACSSRDEESFLPEGLAERLWATRTGLPCDNPLDCYNRVMEALEDSGDLSVMLQRLAGPE